MTAPSVRTILLVDDRDDVRGVLAEYLRRLGYAVLVADGSETALSVAGAPGAAIDALLSDVLLRGVNGADLADAIRRLHPDISVVLMSGLAPDAALRERLRELGARFLLKPFGMEEVVELLRRPS